ncbi:hypothetical protein NTHI1209_00547 [Haemophilus influenzae]|uniref:Uncharacterized protein n=1 Tax=Haemophilus influenzae TaxID=727 RepID=A0A158SVQ0_HAEIF|nr:hypothetical protein NTHI1209_00547 [Haemophilus influenzae]
MQSTLESLVHSSIMIKFLEAASGRSSLSRE